ncbi:MAG: heme-binding protein [Rickettsiales bacterium]|nr:heme-binding protein [Rickettsiales bacterium]
MIKITLASLIVLVSLTGCNVTGKGYEEPRYSAVKTLSQEPDIKIRRYAPMIVAEVTTSGDMKESTSSGFRPLADYIFGNNLAQESMDMTVPVSQQASEKMAMTVPVSQQQEADDQWNVRFYMSDEYTLKSLPKPNNEAVSLREIAGHDAAVLQFSGSSSASNMMEHKQLLETYLAKQNIVTDGPAVYAYYNHPFTPWFLKRNEVMLKLKQPIPE